jgi:hypothetical protein
VGVFELLKDRGKQQPLKIGKGERCSVLYLLSCLPTDWTGGERVFDSTKTGPPNGDPSEEIEFQHRIDITSTSCPVKFHLYFTRDFSDCQLYWDIRALPLSVINRRIEYRESGVVFNWISDVRQTVTVLRRPLEEHQLPHPYSCVMHWLASTWHFDKLVEDVEMLMPGVWLQNLQRRQTVDAARRHLTTMLAELPGWVKVYLTTEPSCRALNYDTGRNLFGLTWVFPWAVELLTLVWVKCAMTDATFKIMRPYVCEILHLCVANESIPIAVAIFPSETGNSYIRMYNHVKDVLVSEGKGGDLLTRLPLLSDLGRGLDKLVRALGLTWKHCHRHLIESVGSNSRSGGWIRRLLLCSTLAQAQRTARIIWAEVLLLPAQVKLKYMQTAGYLRILNMLLDVFNPARKLGLARWARWERLGCPTTTNAVESIHAKLNAILRADKGRAFIRQLGLLQDYLWKRFNTRNSPKRIAKRSVNRYHKEMGKPGFREPTEEPEKSFRAFYRALHSLDVGGKCWMAPGWEYPAFTGNPNQHRGWDEEVVDDELPDGWKKDDHNVPVEPEDPPPANTEIDTPDECLPLPSGWHDGDQSGARRFHTSDDNPHYNAIAWNLVHSIRWLRFKGKWTEPDCRNTLNYVLRIGAPHYPGDHVEVPEADELAWRVQVLAHFHLLEEADGVDGANLS